MRYFFIFNPGSRGGNARKSIARIHELLKAENVNYGYQITESLRDAYVLSRKANTELYDVVVAIGGDGTINQVMNGFYNDDGCRLSKARLGVIYTGTSPDFCKNYQVPYNDLDRSVSVLLKGKTAIIQVGKITLVEKDSFGQSSAVTRFFSCCANVGLGAAIARHANSGIRKKVGDTLGTFIALIKSFMDYKSMTLEVSLDDKKTSLAGVCNISVGKTLHVASGIKIPNALSEGDSRFYIMTIQNVNWTKVPHCLRTIYGGKPISTGDSIHLEYAKYIEISGINDAGEVEFDGDPQGFLPCRIEMSKEGLEVIHEAR